MGTWRSGVWETGGKGGMVFSFDVFESRGRGRKELELHDARDIS